MQILMSCLLPHTSMISLRIRRKTACIIYYQDYANSVTNNHLKSAKMRISCYIEKSAKYPTGIFSFFYVIVFLLFYKTNNLKWTVLGSAGSISGIPFSPAKPSFQYLDNNSTIVQDLAIFRMAAPANSIVEPLSFDNS